MTKIHFELSGHGTTTLLFVHGWAGNSSWWNAQRDYFADRYNVVLMDLPGHGKTPMPEDELTSVTYARAIRAVVDELPGDVILIGHSMSGTYVLEPVLNTPKVKKIIIIDTLKNLDQVFTFEQADKMLFDLYRQDYKHAMQDIMPQFLFSPKTPAHVKERLIGEFLSISGEKSIKLLAPLYKMDPRALAPKVNVPVRAINSDYSPMDVEANKKYFKDFEAVVIADCGHYPMLERPEEFNRLLDQTLHG